MAYLQDGYTENRLLGRSLISWFKSPIKKSVLKVTTDNYLHK
jgi:hypothetical protein